MTDPVRHTSDPVEFLDRAATVVAADPVRHSVVATVADRLVRSPELCSDPWFGWVEEDGRTVAVAMHTPPHAAHLPTQAHAVAFAQHLHRIGRDVPGVGGWKPGAVAFAERWSDLTGVTARVRRDEGTYDLPVAPSLPWPVEGEARIATADDVALIDEWADGFRRDVGEPPAPPGFTLAPRIGEGAMMLWENDNVPVAMVGSQHASGVSRISWVYTPPEHRGHGYASAAVAAISRREQAQDRLCILYTDLANPTSNGIYQAIGYRRLGDSVQLEWQ